MSQTAGKSEEAGQTLLHFQMEIVKLLLKFYFQTRISYSIDEC